jgi:uncharacterized membrane protein
LFKKYFLTGLLIWVPVAVTFWVLQMVIGTLDKSLWLVPEPWRPENSLGFDIPGLGAVLTLLIIFITGVVAANIFGQQMVRWWEQFLHRIPVVRTVYKSVKQVSDTLLSPDGQAFRKAVLVQYPRQGSWTIAFLTGAPSGEIASYLQKEHVSVFVPTTPNPTSGFFLMLPKTDVVELEMSVDEALKYVISMGVVGPDASPEAPPATQNSMAA